MFRNKKFFFVLIPVALFFAVGYVVMWLWNNALLAGVPSLTPITYWQALGIFILSKLLFGGFGGRKSGFGPQRMRDKFKSMSPEDRAAFMEKWKQRGGGC
ncbi:MAG: hypothetical protein IT269_05220 [Saprospiraceae bacterium]|nr:hypothetical protein [Saprospiraceae bacterium]